MRAAFEDITARKGTKSFLAYSFTVKAFEFKWHYHPEYELTLIEKGSGKRLVGDNNETFEEGDLVLVGPQLPHTWVSTGPAQGEASATVIQFSEDFISSFLQHREFHCLKGLLAKSKRGLYFPQQADTALAERVKALAAKEGIEKITALLSILDSLAGQDAQLLASAYFQPMRGEENERRINKVCQYMQKHSTGKISLPEAARLIHLSESAFCKFFKRATGKTFSDYVNDIRIGHACHLLTESDKPIGAIAHDAGFETLTYFNRIFLKKKGLRPTEFRKRALS
jgi:AraC-like DNA-binding protein/quercetin dioxygenase-like cupin family protein